MFQTPCLRGREGGRWESTVAAPLAEGGYGTAARLEIGQRRAMSLCTRSRECVMLDVVPEVTPLTNLICKTHQL